MKKIILIATAIVFGLQVSTAQNARRSDRKIIELKKAVELTAEQETAIRFAADRYNQLSDSILYKVSDAAQAYTLKRQADRQFKRDVLRTLTTEQKRQYFSIISATEMPERHSGKNDELAVMKKRQRSNRKITELKKIINLTPEQEETLRAAYIRHQQTGDSILHKVPEAAAAAELSYLSNKELHSTLMNTLTEVQRNTYIRTNATPEVRAKAEAKVSYLQETGYTDEELAAAATAIFNYLMLEKIVYERDKYDIVSQKENIRMLKKLEPVDLKKANAQEKLKTQGKSVQGRTVW